MSDTKFTAILPQLLQLGDRVDIKGQLNDGAEQFSINFVNTTCRAPDNITYHMKWLVNENQLVEDYKEDGDWMNHLRKDINHRAVLDACFCPHLWIVCVAYRTDLQKAMRRMRVFPGWSKYLLRQMPFLMQFYP